MVSRYFFSSFFWMHVNVLGESFQMSYLSTIYLFSSVCGTFSKIGPFSQAPPLRHSPSEFFSRQRRPRNRSNFQERSKCVLPTDPARWHSKNFVGSAATVITVLFLDHGYFRSFVTVTWPAVTFFLLFLHVCECTR